MLEEKQSREKSWSKKNLHEFKETFME